VSERERAVSEPGGNRLGAGAEPGGSPASIAAYASKGGKARQAQRLTLARVSAVLVFDTPEAVRRSCEQLARWGAAKMLPGSVLGAAVRAGEVALKAMETTVTFETVEALSGDVAALRAERDQLVQELELLRQRRTA